MVDSIVIAVAPSVMAGQYGEFYDNIVAFLGRLVQSSHPDDLVLVVAGEQSMLWQGQAIPEGNLLLGSVTDIWVRDFAPIRTVAGLFKFRYLPSYLRRDDALAIERGFMDWFYALGLEAKQVDLILDGGNFVYNGRDSAVVTERVLEDNRSETRANIQREIGSELQLERLAIIPEGPREKTGHADGMVVWLAEDVLGVARYEEPVRSRVLGALERALPGVDLVELPFEPTGDLWQGWESAAGVYVNALSTDNAFYVPRFGLEADDLAIQTYEFWAAKQVIPVETGREVRLGGSVRCLTWPLSGSDAQRVLEYRGRT